MGALSSIVDQLGYRPREMHGPTAPKEAATDTASSLQNGHIGLAGRLLRQPASFEQVLGELEAGHWVSEVGIKYPGEVSAAATILTEFMKGIEATNLGASKA